MRGEPPARLTSRRYSQPMPPICTLRTKSPWWASTPLVECGKKTGRGQTRCLRSPPKLSRSTIRQRSFELRCDTAGPSARNTETCGSFSSKLTADVHGSKSGPIGLVVRTPLGMGSTLTGAKLSHFDPPNHLTRSPEHRKFQGKTVPVRRLCGAPASARGPLPSPGSSSARFRTGWQRRSVPGGTDIWSFRSRLKSQLPSP